MFEPIFITDTVGDKTEVYVDTHKNDSCVMLKVEDQILGEYLMEEHDSHTYALGSYTVDQAIALRDAIDAALADIEARTPGEEVFELVDRDDYLWIYVAEVNRWACAMDLNDEDDHVTVGSASHSLFVGFDKGAADIIAQFGVKA